MLSGAGFDSAPSANARWSGQDSTNSGKPISRSLEAKDNER